MAKTNWLAIRSDYLTGINPADLAKKHGISRQAIYARMQADKKTGHEWMSRGAVQDKVARDFNERVANDPGLIDSTLSNLRRHDELETLLIDVAIETLRGVKEASLTDKDGVLDTARVDARSRAIYAAVRVLPASRLVHGVPKDMPSVRPSQAESTPEEDGKLIIQTRRLEPKMLPVNADGLKTG